MKLPILLNITSFRLTKYIVTAMITIILFSCSSSSGRKGKMKDPLGYTATRTKMRNAWKRGEFNSAKTLSEHWVNYAKKKRPKDYYINLLEKGKVALACDDYEGAIKALQKAEKRFVNIEGQVSLGEEIGSLFSDDLNKEYEAENYEKLLIPSYLLLAYWQKGDFNGARVESKRVLQKINQYIESSTKHKYLESPFNRLLTALVFEEDGQDDDVKIELRKIAKISKYCSQISKIEQESMEKSRAYGSSICVFADVGTSPMKHPKKYGPWIVTLSNGTTISLAFVYSVIRKTLSRTHKCRVYIDKKYMADTYLLYDVEDIILKQFKKNEPTKISQIKKRALVKATTAGIASYVAAKTLGKFAGRLVGIVGAAWMYSERADLRSWLTLPKNIQYRRVNHISVGEHAVYLEGVDRRNNVTWRTKEKKVHIDEKGTLELVHFTVPN
jgi:hypothetical protein